jgi:hypothetical protein
MLENQACRPEGWSASKPRQQIPGDNELNLKEKKGAEKYAGVIKSFEWSMVMPDAGMRFASRGHIDGTLRN